MYWKAFIYKLMQISIKTLKIFVSAFETEISNDNYFFNFWTIVSCLYQCAFISVYFFDHFYEKCQQNLWQNIWSRLSPLARVRRREKMSHFLVFLCIF